MNPDQYQDLPLDSLLVLRRMFVMDIEQKRSALAEVERHIRMKERPSTPPIFTQDDMEKILTSGGSIRNLMGWVVKALDQHGHVMTATELSDAMYSFTWPIPEHQFRRRVIVSVSAAANDNDPEKRVVVDSGYKGNGREKYWAKPEWMIDGQLPMRRYPVMQPRLMTSTKVLGLQVRNVREPERHKITEATEVASSDSEGDDS